MRDIPTYACSRRHAGGRHCSRAGFALAALALPAPAAAGLAEASVTPLTWWLLAGAGLAAVIVAALSMGRPTRTPRDDDRARPERAGGDVPDVAHFVRDLRDAPPAEALDAPMPLPAAIRTRRAAPHGPRAADAAAPAPSQPATPPAAPPGKRDDASTAPASSAPAPAPDVEPANEVDAGEDADARQRTARLFLALHHVDLSIDVLRRHLQGERRPMPAAWVMLLDLCRTHGREAAFREIAAEFHDRFNVCAPSWDAYPPSRDEPGLEAYPRIVRDLTQSWGTHECRRMLDRLLYDTRKGGRRGFTMNAYNDLIALRRAAGDVLDTIDQDLAEETKVRDAYAQAAADAALAGLPVEPVAASPLVRDLESQLDADLRETGEDRSALEREHPAFADALSREWGNAALAGRLCDMLARGTGGGAPLSPEAQDEVELLRAMAQRLAAVNRLPLPVA